MATVHMIVHMSFEAWAFTNPIHIAVHYAHGFIAIFASRVPAIMSFFSVMEEQSSISKPIESKEQKRQMVYSSLTRSFLVNFNCQVHFLARP